MSNSPHSTKQINIMVAGHPQSGKSTFLRTLLSQIDIRSIYRDDTFYSVCTNTPIDSLASTTFNGGNGAGRSQSPAHMIGGVKSGSIQMNGDIFYAQTHADQSRPTAMNEESNDADIDAVSMAETQMIANTLKRKNTKLRSSMIAASSSKKEVGSPAGPLSSVDPGDGSTPSHIDEDDDEGDDTPLAQGIKIVVRTPTEVTRDPAGNIDSLEGSQASDSPEQSEIGGKKPEVIDAPMSEEAGPKRAKKKLRLLPLPEWRHLEMPGIGRLAVEFVSENWENKVQIRTIDTPSISIPSFYYNNGRNSDIDVGTVFDNTQEMHVSMNYTKEILGGIIDFIDLQFENTLLAELQIDRTKPMSQRKTRGVQSEYMVHCCIYMLDPRVCLSAQGLTKMDHLVLSELTKKVNVILCIGKSDTLSAEEIEFVKRKVNEFTEKTRLPVFGFPELPDFSYSEEQLELNDILREIHPFTVMNPNVLELGGKGAKDTFRVPIPCSLQSHASDRQHIPPIAMPGTFAQPLSFHFNHRGGLGNIKPASGNRSVRRISIPPSVALGGSPTSPTSVGDVASKTLANKGMDRTNYREIRSGVKLDIRKPEHCDFINLFSTLFDTHLDEIVTITQLVYYEHWRATKLTEVRKTDPAVLAASAAAESPSMSSMASGTPVWRNPPVESPVTSAPVRGTIPLKGGNAPSNIRVVIPQEASPSASPLGYAAPAAQA